MPHALLTDAMENAWTVIDRLQWIHHEATEADAPVVHRQRIGTALWHCQELYDQLCAYAFVDTHRPGLTPPWRRREEGRW